MSLAAAITQNTAAMTTAVNTYRQNVVAVNTLMTGVLSSKLPALSNPPSNWSDFTTAYGSAQSEALDWVNTILAQLLSTPTDVQNYNDTLTTALQDAQTKAQSMAHGPRDAADLAELSQDLTTISSALSAVTPFLSSVVTQIQSFNNNLPSLAKSLQNLATDATGLTENDKKKIKTLGDAIDKLQDDINSLTRQETGEGVAGGITLFVGAIGMAAFWPEGTAVWLFLGAAVVTLEALAIVDKVKIDRDKTKIQQAQQTMDGLTSDVAALHLLAQNFGNMATQTQTVETAAQAILAQWQTLQTDVTNAVNDIQSGMTAFGMDEFHSLAVDLAEAATAWQNANTQAGSLHLDLQVTSAQINLGMTKAEAEAALKAGTTMSPIDYYNLTAAA